MRGPASRDDGDIGGGDMMDNNYQEHVNDLMSMSERGTNATAGRHQQHQQPYQTVNGRFGDSNVEEDYNYNDNSYGDDDDDYDDMQPLSGSQRGSQRGSGGGDKHNVLQRGDHVYVIQGFNKQRHGIVYHVPGEGNTSTGILSDDNIFGNGGAEYDDIIIVTFYEESIKRFEADIKKNGRFGRFLRRGNNRVNANSSGIVAKDEDIDEVRESLTGGQIGNSSTNNASHLSREIVKLTLRQFAKGGKKVYKVRYDATRAKRLLSRGGSTTCIKPDQLGLIMARVEYLMNDCNALPEFRKLSANDECVAVWCRTGRWVTLQGASMLEIVSAAQAGSAVAATGVATSMTVTYSMTWAQGMMLVWTVPATVAYPLLVPMLVGYGLTSLVPLEILRRHRRRWKQISDMMNRDFWIEAPQNIKENYFVSSINGKEGLVDKFFGVVGDNKKDNSNSNSSGSGDFVDDEKTKYLPVTGGNGNNNSGNNGNNNNNSNSKGKYSDDVDDDDMSSIERDCNRIAATSNLGVTSNGHRNNNNNTRRQKIVRGVLGVGKNVWQSTSSLVRGGGGGGNNMNNINNFNNSGANNHGGQNQRFYDTDEKGGLMSNQAF